MGSTRCRTVTGGVFWIRPPWVTSKTGLERATELSDQMRLAFAIGNLYGGDLGDHNNETPTGGAYFLLGRLSHIIQDMTSAPHVLWQDVALSHENYDCYWSGLASTNAGLPLLKPSDGIPQGHPALAHLDPLSSHRLPLRVGQVNSDTPEGFAWTLAWMTYFRATVWGEITKNNPCCPTHTISVPGYPDQPNNALSTVFNGKVYFHGGALQDDYWWVEDVKGTVHRFAFNYDLDDWWPAENGASAGQGFPEGHDKTVDLSRISGRFYFKAPGRWWGSWNVLVVRRSQVLGLSRRLAGKVAKWRPNHV